MPPLANRLSCEPKGTDAVAENDVKGGSEAPISEQLKEAAGCGCLGIPVAIFGPIITNLIGISPWPIPIIALLYAGIAFVEKTPLGKMHRKANFSLALILFTFATVSALMTGRDNAEETRKPKPSVIAAQTDEPAAVADPAVPSIHDEVRVDIDEILRRYAQNQIGAAQYFEGKTAIVSAKAVRVREALGTGILVAQSTKTGKRLEIGFDEQGTRELGDIEPGDRIEARCPKINEAMGQVFVVCTSISVTRK